MNYFYDMEFLEGTQDKTFMGIKYGKTLPTIQPISIGMVSGDGRELYCVFNDFNLKEAWNRFDVKVETMYGDARNIFPEGRKTKVYWIRENVLRPIWEDLEYAEYLIMPSVLEERISKEVWVKNYTLGFTQKRIQFLLKKYGKSTKAISKEIFDFCMPKQKRALDAGIDAIIGNIDEPVNLYGYFSAYDHVCLCWLFGKMIDLPDGFPYYTIDLQQELDNKADEIRTGTNLNKEQMLETIKGVANYPKQGNEHHALSDAKWNQQLYEFIKTLN